MQIIFTKHSLERISERGILKEDIINLIIHPEKITKKHGKTFYKLNNLEVCCEQKEKVIKAVAAYWI